MKTKLLRKLRKGIQVYHAPETKSWKERWILDNLITQETNTFYSIEEVLRRYHTIVIRRLDDYMDQNNIKRII